MNFQRQRETKWARWRGNASVGGTLYHFGVLTSAMHMAWVNAVCGRLGSGYRYSKDVVYNNYPWPVAGAGREKHSASIEKCAQAVLDARAAAVAADPKNTLADLYNPTGGGNASVGVYYPPMLS